MGQSVAIVNEGISCTLDASDKLITRRTTVPIDLYSTKQARMHACQLTTHIHMQKSRKRSMQDLWAAAWLGIAYI